MCVCAWVYLVYCERGNTGQFFIWCFSVNLSVSVCVCLYVCWSCLAWELWVQPEVTEADIFAEIFSSGPSEKWNVVPLGFRAETNRGSLGVVDEASLLNLTASLHNWQELLVYFCAVFNESHLKSFISTWTWISTDELVVSEKIMNVTCEFKFQNRGQI